MERSCFPPGSAKSVRNPVGAQPLPPVSYTHLDVYKRQGDYDLIATGDLGQVGSELLYELLGMDKIHLQPRHKDWCKAFMMTSVSFLRSQKYSAPLYP